MTSLFQDYSKLLRLTGLGGLAIAPVFGAISVGVFSIPELAVIFSIGIFATVFGFVLNDYADIEIDKLSKELKNRPLVKGTISKKTALYICLICVIASFIISFIFFYKNQISFYLAILTLILAAILGSIYNLYGKKIIGSDVFVALSEALIVLFGALIVLKENMTLTIFTWIICILAFNQLLFMNAISGGIKDADNDYLLNVKNIALSSGVKVEKGKIFVPLSFKTFGIGIRLFSCCLVFVPFVVYNFGYQLWNLLLLGFFVIVVIFLSIRLITTKIFDRNKIRKLVTSQELFRYYFVPIMLIPFIGELNAFILIIFPFVWYIIFKIITGEKLSQPGLDL